MSKLSPLGQSMAALFTPEGERLRSTQKDGASGGAGTPSATRGPGNGNQVTSHKSQDSLGNPNSPGYESWGKKKNPQDPSSNETQPGSSHPDGQARPIRPPDQGGQFIGLGTGWEKLLLAQKKLCEKARGLFTLLEGPVKYSSSRRSKMLLIKSRGCIVDLDLQEIADKDAAEAKAKAEKEKKTA